jgi:hypothetical protein
MGQEEKGCGVEEEEGAPVALEEESCYAMDRR